MNSSQTPARPGKRLEALSILYEDGHLLAVDKPAGIHSSPLREGEPGTFLGRVIERYPEVAGLPGIKSMEPGLLHRLDRETSGVLLVARTVEAFERLHAEFAAGRVKKEYLAVCIPVERDKARWESRLRIESRFAPFGPGGRKVRVILPEEEGKRAARKAAPDRYLTEAEVLEARGPLLLVRAVLVRGFRHQVRAHLACFGLPIAGDPLYGAPVPPGAAARLYLHAAAVELLHPADGSPLRIRSPLPPEFRAVLSGAPG
jgi:23S rRNA pseudouridine1911/1915/1917 synthase